MRDNPVVSIIIPAYNEADSIVQAIERVRAVPLEKPPICWRNNPTW